MSKTKDILVKNVDVELLKKQYDWLLDQVEAPSLTGSSVDQPELYGLLDLVEYMRENAE